MVGGGSCRDLFLLAANHVRRSQDTLLLTIDFFVVMLDFCSISLIMEVWEYGFGTTIKGPQ